MLGRLFLGIGKGLLVGVLLGVTLAKLGLAAPSAIVAYPAAALVGVLIGLIAGKPIWAEGAKIEAGLKAFVGALVGAGLMFVARRWLPMAVPFSLGAFSAPNASLNEAANTAGTLGGLAVTSLPLIAALLGAFYEIDNDPSESRPQGPSSKAASGEQGAGERRVAPPGADAELEDEIESEAENKRAQK